MSALFSVIVNVDGEPVAIGLGENALLTVGGVMAVIVAVTPVVLMTGSAVMFDALFTKTPALASATGTLIVQLALAATSPPTIDTDTELPPTAALTTPLPQVVVAVPATVIPEGKLSVRPKSSFALVFTLLICSVNILV